MKSLLASVAIAALVLPAAAADLQRAVPLKASPPPVANSYPIYAIVEAGIGFSSQQNDLTIPGLDVQGSTPKEYATGALVGAGFGVQGITGIGQLGFEAKINYIFSRASFGCDSLGFGCAGTSKNNWLFQAMGYYTPFPAPLSFTGWSWTQALNIAPGFGAATRTLDICLNDQDPFSVTFGKTLACDTKWLVGWDAGAKIEAPLGSSGAKFRFTYDFIGWNESVTHSNSPVFRNPAMNGTSTYKVQNEQLIKAGVSIPIAPLF